MIEAIKDFIIVAGAVLAITALTLVTGLMPFALLATAIELALGR